MSDGRPEKAEASIVEMLLPARFILLPAAERSETISVRAQRVFVCVQASSIHTCTSLHTRTHWVRTHMGGAKPV